MLTERLSTRIAILSSHIAFRYRAWLYLIFLILPTGLPAGNNNTLLLLSGDSAVYHKAAELTIEFFEKNCSHHTCKDTQFKKALISDQSNRQIDARLILTYGTRAAVLPKTLADYQSVIHAMLPRQNSTIKQQTNLDHKSVDIYIDQPFSRYFQLISATIPRATRVGILIHESNKSSIDSLTHEAKTLGLTLNIALVKSGNIGKSLSRLLGEIDVLLAIPDSRIHNSKTISNILTTSYRNKIPVIGFSSAYVKAGAVAGVFTSLDNIAQEAAEAALNVFNSNAIPSQQNAAKYFSISINTEVARSLGIKLPPTNEVMKLIDSELVK
ncbi:MAG: hypothetical protein KZQ93_06050 [Candidatus Thiodiazotropha sp. (ex Monitilora ramsayi)]|nr:hypothetical protein [Candidatus Thiodiazotropha sp. (ex Monitilora ramsayi)]